MCSITGVGESLHKVLGQIDLGTLDSGERSLPFGLLVSTNLPKKLLFPSKFSLPLRSLIFLSLSISSSDSKNRTE